MCGAAGTASQNHDHTDAPAHSATSIRPARAHITGGRHRVTPPHGSVPRSSDPQRERKGHKNHLTTGSGRGGIGYNVDRTYHGQPKLVRVDPAGNSNPQAPKVLETRSTVAGGRRARAARLAQVKKADADGCARSCRPVRHGKARRPRDNPGTVELAATRPPPTNLPRARCPRIALQKPLGAARRGATRPRPIPPAPNPPARRRAGWWRTYGPSRSGGSQTRTETRAGVAWRGVARRGAPTVSQLRTPRDGGPSLCLAVPHVVAPGGCLLLAADAPAPRRVSPPVSDAATPRREPGGLPVSPGPLSSPPRRALLSSSSTGAANTTQHNTTRARVQPLLALISLPDHCSSARS